MTSSLRVLGQVLTRRWFPASASLRYPRAPRNRLENGLPTSAAGLEQFPVGKEAGNQPPDNDVQTFDYAFAFCFAAQRAFINSDNFFLAAALIAGRAFVFVEADF